MMTIKEEKLEAAAEVYSACYGVNAYSKVGDDINMAIGLGDWDGTYVLQQVQWRVRKLERLRQIAEQLRHSRKWPDPFDAICASNVPRESQDGMTDLSGHTLAPGTGAEVMKRLFVSANSDGLRA